MSPNNNSILISVFGDLASRLRFDDMAKIGDVKAFFGDTLSITKSSDLSIVNLEAPLIDAGNPITKSGPNIKATPAVSKMIKQSGIGLACLANNHIMDYGEEGLRSTLDHLKLEEIDYCGAGFNKEEAAKIYFKGIKGKRIAIINIAENEFGNAGDNSPGAASLNLVANYYQVKTARDKADYVIVIVHGGHETFEYPSLRMRDTYRFFIDNGADAVIGHHTHCFSGHEIYKEKPIVYSLGNYIFDNGSKNISSWNYGVIALITIENEAIKLSLKKFSQALPNQDPAPKFVSDEENELFQASAIEKSKIIASDELLKAEFDKFVKTSAKKYRLYLEPTSNRYLLGLVSKGIINSLRDKKKDTLLLNIIRCEAHRDVLLSVLTENK